jgi:hypothetical protein
MIDFPHGPARFSTTARDVQMLGDAAPIQLQESLPWLRKAAVRPRPGKFLFQNSSKVR